MMDIANRIQGGLECRRGGDAVGGEKHELDGWGAAVNRAATIQTRRSARGKTNDILLKKRDTIAKGTRAQDMMYALGKREQAQNEFFRKGGAGIQPSPQPWPSYGAFKLPNPFTFQHSLTTPFFFPPPFSSAAVPTTQSAHDPYQQYPPYNPYQHSPNTYLPSQLLNTAGGVPAQPFIPRG
jgi:hypothetical protein